MYPYRTMAQCKRSVYAEVKAFVSEEAKAFFVTALRSGHGTQTQRRQAK